jgi:hypothetical protein
MKKNFRIHHVIDVKIGLAGGLVMGIIVFMVNYYAANDLMGSFTAALKQGIYTFFFGGIIMKLCEVVAIKINPGLLAIILAVLIPSIISLALTFGLHSMKGTPKPVESTIPTAIFVIPSTLVWGIIKRKRKLIIPGKGENTN